MHHFLPPLETKGPPLGLAAALAEATQTRELQGIPWGTSLAAGPTAPRHTKKLMHSEKNQNCHVQSVVPVIIG